METVTQHLEDSQAEPAIRTVTREVPNLRNADVAEEYRRQRAVIAAASANRREEIDFWESVQTDEGWV